jgi:hypothetical protein
MAELVINQAVMACCGLPREMCQCDHNQRPVPTANWAETDNNSVLTEEERRDILPLPTMNYGGAVVNADPYGGVDRKDILPLPTINWAAEAKAANREQPKPCYDRPADDDVLPLPRMVW